MRRSGAEAESEWSAQHMGEPAWLKRASACGSALSSAEASAAAAGVSVTLQAGSEWVLQAAALERRCFAKAEAMDIGLEVSTYRASLICASPTAAWSGIDIGPSVQPGDLVGFAVLHRGAPRPAGDALLTDRPITVNLSKLVVSPHLRRKGIGRALLAHSISEARSSRAVAVTLHVEETNSKARALYAAAGFAVETRIDHYYSRGRHALVMKLQLELA